MCLPPKSSFLLAVSGGRDSMIMLDLFARRMVAGNPDQITRLEVVSVDHGVRGPQAQADVSFVELACQKWGISFHSIRLEPLQLQGPGGFESLARTARYQAMLSLKKTLGLQFLCTAHHRRDQAETVLLRMARGTGMVGLRGILSEREDGVLRPLLAWSSLRLAEYAREHQVTWREDPTNLDLRHARNRVRHVEMPALQKQIPELEQRLAQLAALASLALPKIQVVAQAVFGPTLLAQEGGDLRPELRLERLEVLKRLPGREELWRIWLWGQGISVDSSSINAMKNRLCFPWGHLDLKGGLSLDCSGIMARVGHLRPNAVMERSEDTMALGPNLYLLGWQFRDPKELSGELACTDEVAWLDADQLQGEPVLRTRQEGDRFSPPGLRSRHRKLKKYFHESGIVRSDRDTRPVVAFADEVLWVPGYAVSGNFQVQSQTKTVIELRLECRKTTHSKMPFPK